MKLKVLKALLFILFTTMGYTNLLAQPSLGDIVITGYNSDGDPSNPDVDDEFVVTLLADMVGSTIISFTDNGWFASGGFRAGEGTITLSMANAYSCGSEIRFVKDGNGLWSALDETGTPTGSITQTGDLALSSSGDQIMVYSGSIAPTASDESAFITALHFGGATWDADATGSVESAQPSIFINNPGNDFAVAHQDNGKFNCSGIGSTTNAFPPDLRANIYDASHWDFTNSSTSRFDLSQFCNFSCEPCLDPIISSISTNRLNNSFCLGDLIVISIDGSANDAATWGLYTGSCGDNLVNSIPGDSTTFELTASTSTTYFIRGEGGCIGNNGNCTSIEVVVGDTEAPLLTCPANINTVNDPDLCSAIVNFNVSATDNCDPDIAITYSQSSGTPFLVGATIVSVTATDDFGNSRNCSFEIIVADAEAPAFSNCPTNIAIPNDPGSCGAIVNWTAPDLTDNCSAPTISASHLPGDFFPVGTTTVSYTGIDEAANQAMDCTFSVTVDDSEAPAFSNCPTNITISNDPGSCGAIVNWIAPDLTDNCSAPTISASHFPGDFFPVGTTTVSYTGIDEAANQATDCTFSITVDDSEVPIAICRNLTIQLDATGNASITVDEVNNGSNGACGAVVLTLDDYEFDCNDIGSTAVTLLATDSGGNTASCTAIIEVEDNIQPMITACPSSLNACGSQAIDWTPPVASDNCTVSISSNFTPSAIFPEGTTTVLYTATDDGGNTASCSFDITIYPVPAISIVQETLPNLCQGIAQLSAEVSNVSSLITPLTYAWSGGLGNESTALVLENGSYELSVTDSRGCTAVTMTTLNVDIDRSLSGYVLLSKKNEIELKRSTVNGGGIGMLNQDGKVKLDDQTVVNTFVKAKQIEVTGGSDLANSIQQTAGVTLPPFLGHNRSGGNDITVSENSSVTLSGDLYKKIIVEKNATLIFDNPEVFIEEMETKEGAIVDFAQDAVLRIKKDLKIDKENSFNPVSRAVVVYLKEKLEVKENSDFKATVYTEDKIETKGESANKPTNMTGLFIAIEEIKSDKWTNWNWSNNCNLNLGGNNQPFIAINGANGRDSNEELMPLDFKVFPNPASDHLNLDLGQFNDQPIAIQVFHVNGQLIHNQRFSNFSASNLQLNTNAWADGTYFIRVIVNDKFPYMKKVLIQHP